MKLSHLNGLRALEATLRRGTFTAAAEELGVTVAAIGQQIRGLEAYLDVKLFDRLPAGAKPTPEALAVATRLTVSFTKIDEVFGELGLQRNAGRLRIASSHSMLNDWIAPRMPSFHGRHAGIAVSYDIGEEYVDLFSGDADMAVRFSPKPGPEFSFEPLFRGCCMPVCTPAFADRYSLGPMTRDLTGVPLFQLHDITTDLAWVDWSALMKTHAMTKSDPGPVQQVSGYRTALSGEGLVLCGLTESFEDLAAQRLAAPLGPAFVNQLTYGYRLVWPAGKTLTRPMRNFRDWILVERDTFLEQASDLLGVPLERSSSGSSGQ